MLAWNRLRLVLELLRAARAASGIRSLSDCSEVRCGSKVSATGKM